MDISVVMYGGHDVRIIKHTKTYRISRKLAETIGTKDVDFNFIIIKFAHRVDREKSLDEIRIVRYSYIYGYSFLKYQYQTMSEIVYARSA